MTNDSLMMDMRDIGDILRRTAFRLGTIFSEPIKSQEHPASVPRLTLDDIIQRTQIPRLVDHHQTYAIDGYLAHVARVVLEGMINELKEIRLYAGIRIEHDAEETRDGIKKVITIVDGSKKFIVHTNPIDGSDNYSAALNSWARYQKAGITIPINPDSCVTLALAKKTDPFNPIATAVYNFRNHQVYGAFRGYENVYLSTMGVVPATILYHRVTELGKKDIRFFIADYKYDIVDVPAILEQALIDYGNQIGVQIDRIRGTVASTSNILKAVIEGETLGYFDYRPAEPLKGIKGKYASLKATNVLAVLPIAIARGYEYRNIRGELLADVHKFDLSKSTQNPDISLLLVPKDFYHGGHFNVLQAVNGVADRIDARVRLFVQANSGTGYQIPGHTLDELISGEGAYKSVWGVRRPEDEGSPIVVKIFDYSKRRGTSNLVTAGMSQGDLERNERRIEAARDNSDYGNYIAFMYGLKRDGKSPDGSDVIYLVERRFKQTFAQKYRLGQIAPLDEIVKFGSHLVNAVTAGHDSRNRCPLIHGDIKDENFGESFDGNGSLTDYGVSFLVDVDKERSANIGSIHTMAPELYQKDNQPTTQSDVFAIGCVLFKLATGYHPFSPHIEKPSGVGEARRAYEEETTQQKDLPDYSHIYARIVLPEELRNIVIKAMQKDPEKRYSCAVEMVKEFARVVEIHRLYKQIMGDIEKDTKGIETEPHLHSHLLLTEDWLLALNPNASYASRIAALTHDIERTKPNPVRYEGQPDDLDLYVKYKQEHANQSAEQVRELLSSLGATSAFTDQVVYIVKFHDIPQINQDIQNRESVQEVVDADSLSYFQNNVKHYITKHCDEQDRIMIKMKFMYDRMSERAKRLLDKQSFFEMSRPYIIPS